MCSPDGPLQLYGSETGGQKTQGLEGRYKETPKFPGRYIGESRGKRGNTPGVETPAIPDEVDEVDAVY